MFVYIEDIYEIYMCEIYANIYEIYMYEIYAKYMNIFNIYFIYMCPLLNIRWCLDASRSRLLFGMKNTDIYPVRRTKLNETDGLKSPAIKRKIRFSFSENENRILYSASEGAKKKK